MAQQAQAEVEAEVPEIPEEVSEELTMLKGFRDLVGERFGYWIGRKNLTKKMNEEIEEERKIVRDIRNHIKESIPEWIENSNLEEYNQQNEALDEAKEERTKAKEATGLKPQISDLKKAVRFMDNTAIPEALEELGAPVQPRFTLSDYIAEAIEAED